MRAVPLLAAALTLGALASTANAQAAPAAPAAPPAAATPAAPVRPPKLPADSLELARKWTRWFYTAQADSLAAAEQPGNRTQDAAKADYINALSELTARVGTETEVLEEAFITRKGFRQYWRTAKFSNFPEPVMVRWVFDTQGRIAGFGMNPKSAAPPVDPAP
jgi:hypothetical protein